jgi:hypothetical protein
MSYLSEQNVLGAPKFVVTNTTFGLPTTGPFGGTGTEIILSTGTSTGTPYALGMNTNTLWYGVPSGASHVFYGGNSGTTELLRLGPSGAMLAKPNVCLSIVMSGTWTMNSTGFAIFGSTFSGSRTTNTLISINNINSNELYNANSGVFSAPVRGIYSFSTNMRMSDIGGDGCHIFETNISSRICRPTIICFKRWK